MIGRGRRAFVLIAVLVVVASALLVATSLLFVAQAEAAGAAGTARAVQSRALAWSGVQAVMSTLNDQRDRILNGELPQVSAEYTIYETETRLGVVRLLPISPRRERLVPEAGGLDLNHVDADMLGDTGLLDAVSAQAVVSFRENDPGRGFGSVAELLNVPGLTPETVYGPIDELTVEDDAFESGVLTERASTLYGHESPRGLADVVTVYGFEPALQQNGKRRINLNVPWSDELGRRLDQRFGAGSSEILRRIFESGTTFENDAKIFGVLRFFDMDPSDWPQIIDALTTDPGEYHFGRLDINTASYEALVALPGIDAEQAAALVRVRESLSAEERATVAWPAIRGIVEPEAYDQLAGRITTRSWTYRVRVEAGEVNADDREGALTNPVIYEAVIDLSAPKPRVAYLRDITMLQSAARVAANATPAPAPGITEDPDDALREPFMDEPAPLDDPDPGFGATIDDPRTDQMNDPSPAPPSSPAAATPSRRRLGRWLHQD